jgi:hypothetical protein
MRTASVPAARRRRPSPVNARPVPRTRSQAAQDLKEYRNDLRIWEEEGGNPGRLPASGDAGAR